MLKYFIETEHHAPYSDATSAFTFSKNKVEKIPVISFE